MKTYVSRTRVRQLLEDSSDAFYAYEPAIFGAGKEMANKYIKKMTDRINYIINNKLTEDIFVTQETTDMFPEDSTIDYFCDWVLTVNIEKQTIDIEIINAGYQKAVMVPFIDLGNYE